MDYDVPVELLLALQQALNERDWDNETAVVNYANQISKKKISNAAQINQLIMLAANQMKYNYPLRGFVTKPRNTNESEDKKNE